MSITTTKSVTYRRGGSHSGDGITLNDISMAAVSLRAAGVPWDAQLMLHFTDTSGLSVTARFEEEK